MKAQNLILFAIIALLFNCTISDIENLESESKESCDFEICEEGRDAVDTLIDVHGVLRKINDLYYVEVTGNAPEPDTSYISCISEGIIFPKENSYVQLSGIIKDQCSEEPSHLKDSILLQKIELINPIAQDNCEKKILNEGYDNNQIDENLSIHYLKVNDGCLSILVSFNGNCNQIPEVTLHNSNDILFGDGVMVNVNLQGEIHGDCDVRNYAVLKYNITPLWDILNYPSSTKITLYFQSQGNLRIG